MDAADLRLRNVTYGLFVKTGRAPTVAEVAEAAGIATAAAAGAWRRLADSHAIVLRPGTTDLLMANPFSAVPTPHRVHADGRWWHANCAWDAFGICAALGVDGTIQTTCPDCGDDLIVAVSDRQPDQPALRFHALVPAVRWWDDIVFT